jgi:hypothetical protein
MVVSGLGPLRIPYIHLGEPERFKEDSSLVYKTPELVGSFFARDGKSICFYIKTTEGISKAKSDSLLSRIDRAVAAYKFDDTFTASKAKGRKSLSRKTERRICAVLHRLFFAGSSFSLDFFPIVLGYLGTCCNCTAYPLSGRLRL